MRRVVRGRRPFDLGGSVFEHVGRIGEAATAAHRQGLYKTMDSYSDTASSALAHLET